MRASLFLTISLTAAVANAATHQVSIQSMSFDPAQLTIAPGDTVTWTVVASFHTTTSDTGAWNSPTMGVGEQYSFTFPNAGAFPYHCSLHTVMTAVINVAAPKVGTTTTLGSSSNPSVVGQNATLTATVTKSGSIGFEPSGSVSFTSDGAPLCTAVALNGGTASCSTAALTVGTHSIVASYVGDANFEASSSAPLLQTVNAAAAAPGGLVALAPSTTQVSLTWSAVNGATGYEVHRSALGAPFTLLTTTNDPAALDASVAAGTTYVYKVRALSTGAPSEFSAPDLATTIVYATDSIVRASHIGDLRTGVNAVRAAAGLGAATFTDHPLAIGTLIRALHVNELRTALNAARSIIGVPALAYTDPSVTAGSTPVRSAHVTELRAGTR